MISEPRSLADLVARARALLRGPHRAVLGIAGAPGSGKSTLAAALVQALADEPPEGMSSPGWVAHVPLDGFHLADLELDRLGLLEVKGAPQTFDGAGYAALIGRIVADTGDTVYAPSFGRDLEQPIAGSLPVPPGARLVITEGNYLCLDAPPWSTARALMTQVWHCRPSEERRRAQLIARHTTYGKDPQRARAWALGPDEANAELVERSAERADLVIGDSVLAGLSLS